VHYLTGPETTGTLLVTVSGLGSNHSGMGKPIVRWVVPFPHLQETTLEGWHRERQGVRTASRSSDRRARTLDVGERMAHALDGSEAKNTDGAWWPSAGVSGGGRDLTLRADDLTSLGTTSPKQPNLTRNNLTQKARFSSWALSQVV
jgi:hypothetical protein